MALQLQPGLVHKQHWGVRAGEEPGPPHPTCKRELKKQLWKNGAAVLAAHTPAAPLNGHGLGRPV